MKIKLFLAVFLTMAVVPPFASAQSNQKQSRDKSSSERAAATQDSTYVIGPEDVLDINVWKQPDVSRIIPVRPDGKISLPLLNDVQAAGLTPMELQSDLTTRLKKFISEPQVTVIVNQINSRRIFVLGEVLHPGAFPMLPKMTVLQALSMAGGFSQFAKETGIYVMRTETGKQVTFPFNYKDVVRGQKPEENIFLKPGDTIVIP
jgi:polysaccharide biosynthesis/export protein